MRVIGAVSGLTAMVVTDGSFAGGKLERAHELGTRAVDPGTYVILLEHLQPVNVAKPKPQRIGEGPTTTAVPGTTSGLVVTTTSPGEIRAWGIANGHPVGVRGRLSAELVEAYQLAMLSAQAQGVDAP